MTGVWASVPVTSLPPPSPESLALAGVWATLIDLAVMGLILFWAVDAFAPPQDLAWKPLRLTDPPGLATALKFERAAADRGQCRTILREGGVGFSEVEPRTFGDCAQVNAVRLGRGVTPLSPVAPVMTCPEALAYVFWDRHTLRPAARQELGQRVTAVEHYGTYACRNMYNREGAMRSEHAFANALDVAAFRLEDGGRASILKDFRGEDDRGRFLRRVRTGACQWFKAVLSPDYNTAHRDHLHLDRGRYRACR